MDTMSVTQFRERALEVLKRVDKEQKGILLTKRGRPIAHVLPYTEPAAGTILGSLAHLLTYEDDTVSPLGKEQWESARGAG